VKYENTKEYPCGKFRRMRGMKRKMFEKAVEILNAKHAAEHAKNARKSGRKPKLCIQDKLLATLEYLREYRTMAHIAASYGVAESSIHATIGWVENTLVKDGTFSLPGKKVLLKEAGGYDVVLVDATETPIERPKKTAEVLLWQEKRHAVKTQVAVCSRSWKIICAAFANGKRHDFRLFRESRVRIAPEVGLMADTGYQGIAKMHANSELPRKRSKRNPLTEEDRRRNRAISSGRVSNERAIGFVKHFRIVSEKYRTRRRRFGLRFDLVAGICNYELSY